MESTNKPESIEELLTKVDKIEMFLPGEIIQDRYIIASVLGKGASGTVYLAEEISTRLPVAIKASRNVLALRETTTLSHEKKVYEALSTLPGIPEMQEFLTEKLRHLLIMPYLGKSMQQIFVKRGALTHVEACRMGISVLETLEGIHKKGILHRDIKPENILYDGDYHLTDFGAARFVSGTQGRRYVGTPAFSSVHVDRGGIADITDDYESLMYCIVAVVGELPWLRKDWCVVDGSWRDLKENGRASVGRNFPDAFKQAWRGVRERNISSEMLKKLLSEAAWQADCREEFGHLY